MTTVSSVQEPQKGVDNPGFVDTDSPVFSSKIKDTGHTFKESVIYSWKDVNAFTHVSKSKFQLPCFKSTVAEEPKHILKNVSGVAKPGEILAIMGASGAGKTTLLNILTFRNTISLKVSGSTLVNGVPIDADTLKLLSAYIQQEDIFIGTLTAREHLRFQALLRMDKQYSYKQRMARVEDVLQQMGLTGCADTIIGIPGLIKGLSGGQQKRLSVASEIITDPQLLICDEPTTGIDYFMAKSLVTTLKSLAKNGKTIICTIHQPASDIFAMFDKLLLMSEGRIAYFGVAEKVASYFSSIGYPCPENYNPADFFIHKLAIRAGDEENCLQRSKDICDRFMSSELSGALNQSYLDKNLSKTTEELVETMKKGAAKRKKSPYKASWLSQFRACLWRSWITVLKNPMFLRVQLIQTVFLALVIGVLYFGQEMDQEGIQNISGCIFIIMANLTFSSVFPVMNVFWQELPVFLREHFNGMYRTDAYYLAKTMAELPVYLCLPVLYISIVYFMVGFNPAADRFIAAVAIVVLVANVGSSFGYMASTISPSFDATMALAPIFVMPFMLFGGTFLNKDSIPVYFIWLKYLSWFLHGNEAMSINQWRGVKDIECNSNFTCVENGEQVLENLSFNEDNFWPSLAALGALIIGTRFISFLGLAMKTRRSQ